MFRVRVLISLALKALTHCNSGRRTQKPPKMDFSFDNTKKIRHCKRSLEWGKETPSPDDDSDADDPDDQGQQERTTPIRRDRPNAIRKKYWQQASITRRQVLKSQRRQHKVSVKALSQADDVITTTPHPHHHRTAYFRLNARTTLERGTQTAASKGPPDAVPVNTTHTLNAEGPPAKAHDLTAAARLAHRRRPGPHRWKARMTADRARPPLARQDRRVAQTQRIGRVSRGRRKSSQCH